MNTAYADMLHICRIIASRWAMYLLMVIGLSLSFCTAIIIGLYVHDELSYDRFIGGSDKAYLLSAHYGPPGRPLVVGDVTPAGMARWMKSDMPDVEAVARLNAAEWPMRTARRDVRERFFWADSNIFEILRLPVLYGDLKTALDGQGKVVLTAKMARAYFGREDVLGQTLTTKDNTPLTVTAVLRDFPPSTHLDREIFVSGSGPYAMLAILDRNPDLLWQSCYTYVRFKGEVSRSDVQSELFRMSRKHWQGPSNLPEAFELVPLFDLHFRPHGDGEMKPRGHLSTILALTVVAAAILALAGINFCGLILAEINERGSETILRKALGARRQDLIFQVLSEAFWVNLISALFALAITERLLPSLNASLDLKLTLWDHPFGVLILLALTVVIVSLLSAIYPAFVVSKPVTATDQGINPRSRLVASDRWFGWVIAQLALVIVLLISSHTMYRQWIYANQDAPRFNGDNVLMIKFGDNAEANKAFSENVRSIKGVEAAAESFGAPTTEYVRPGWINLPNGRLISFTRNSVHPNFFRVYQVPFLAGHNLSGTFLSPEAPTEIIINTAAVKTLGFKSPQAALGQFVIYNTDRTQMRSRIIGVIPNLRFATLYEPDEPMIFDNFSKYFTQVNVKLSADQMADTIAEIDRLWRRDTANAIPIERQFFGDYLKEQYHDLHQQLRVFNLVSVVAIILSTLGLTGLSIFLTRNQVREIAIRRALGATSRDIFLQRITPFIIPLVVANLIAWPTAFFVLQTWLRAFSEGVPLSPVSFLGAGAVCVLFALVTITAYSAISTRKNAIPSLRHE